LQGLIVENKEQGDQVLCSEVDDNSIHVAAFSAASVKTRGCRDPQSTVHFSQKIFLLKARALCLHGAPSPIRVVYAAAVTHLHVMNLLARRTMRILCWGRGPSTLGGRVNG
jgi:hypothetical protein